MLKINEGQPKRGKPFDGYSDITFTNPWNKGNVQGKYKKGFKLGKCFILSDNKIAQIRGKFVNDELKVTFKGNLKSNFDLIYEKFMPYLSMHV